MKQLSQLFLILSITTIIGCTKEIPYPDLNSNQSLVMNGLISPTSGVQVHLSQNCHLSDQNCENKNIETASVILTNMSNNETTELEYTQDGLYSIPSINIENNNTYKIEAKHSELGNINAVSSIPNDFNSELLEFKEKDIHGYLCWSFDIEIEDNPDEENYYLIDGWIDIKNGSHQHYDNDINGYFIPHTGFLTTDPNAENTILASVIDITQVPLEYIFLPDTRFNGSTYTIEVGLNDEDIRANPNYELEAHVYVKSVSKELYEYYKSVTKNKLSEANIVFEPQQIFSNIEGGIGIFGGYTEQEFIIELPKSEFIFPHGLRIQNQGCTSPCTVNFFAEGGGDNIEYNWSFGDGATSTEKNPEHMYDSPGRYVVELNVVIGQNGQIMRQEIEIR